MSTRPTTAATVAPGSEPFRSVLTGGGVILFDGAMGTMLYGKGVFINRAFEELNVVRPGLVRDVHAEYLAAGADVLETNTFAANRFRLSAHGLAGRVEELNRSGAELAADVAAGRAWVAGAMGPLGVRIEPFGPIAREEAREVFREQARALLAGGVDLFLLETFTHVPELMEAIRAVRELDHDLPVIAQMSVAEGGVTREGVSAAETAESLAAEGADAVGVNCSDALAVLDALEEMARAVDLPLSGQPNAGQPRTVDGRNIYMASPDYLVTWAGRALRSGATLLGGCCGTTPAHIRALREAATDTVPKTQPQEVALPPEVKPRSRPVPTVRKSALGRALSEGRFVTGVELPLPTGWVADEVIASSRALADAGLAFLSLPEGSHTEARMPPLAVAQQLLGLVRQIEPVVTYSCRERRLSRIQSDLLGACAGGVSNLLLVTGEPSGPEAYTRDDLDVDSIGVTNLVTRLNHGQDLAGNPIGRPTRFLVGVRLDPTAFDRERELSRFYWKVDAGADFAVTTPVFDVTALGSLLREIQVMEELKEHDVPVIATVWPLRSAREAEFFEHEQAGVPVPRELVERMEAAEEDGRELEEGIEIAREVVKGVEDMVQGVQVVAPDGRAETALRVLDVLG